MFDLMGAIVLTAAAAAIIGPLTVSAFTGATARLGAGAVLAAWAAALIAATASFLFDRRLGLGVTALGIAVAGPLAIALLLFGVVPGLTAALRRVPTSLLVAVNAVRVAGVLFVLLYLGRRLPAPFAPIAGGGDIFIGATAPFVAWLVARRAHGAQPLLWLWNGLGVLDLLTAIGLGVVSADGSPLRLIVAEPASNLITTLPWILIPAYIVPMLMLTHIAIFARLGAARSGTISRAAGDWASSLSR